ncbi:MAG: hypothetical protein HOK28_04080 [Deltaproteobacteria bacterium]|nr:hypothetical protein [Deltaproteobacteria bacterium]
MNLHFPREFRDTLFKLDPRSLLAFRLLLTTALFTDLAERFFNTSYFFTESGVFPEPLWDKLYGFKPYYWSMHFSDSDIVIWGLVGLQVILAGCLVLGYRLRITLLMSWVLLLSMNLGNPLLTYGGDKLSPGLLLIAAIIPLTVAQRQKAGHGPLTYLAGFLMLTQVTMLYTAAGAAKVWQVYWMNGDALYNAMNFNLLVKPLGLFLLNFETFLRVSSWATPWAEIILPMLCWIPSWKGRIRTLALLGILSLNIGIWLTMDVGYFMFYSSAAVICLLPAIFWDTIAPLTSRMQQWLQRPGFTLGRRITAWLAHETQPVLEDAASARPSLDLMSKLRAGIMVWLILVLSISGLEGMKVWKRVNWPSPIWNAVRAPNLYQNWGLFTNPNTQLQWYVSKATLANGRIVDILQDGAPVSFPRPTTRPELFRGNFRWRLAFAKANKHKKHTAVRSAITSNVARIWNDHHGPDEQVQSLQIFKMSKVLSKTYAYKRHWKSWGNWAADKEQSN